MFTRLRYAPISAASISRLLSLARGLSPFVSPPLRSGASRAMPLTGRSTASIAAAVAFAALLSSGAAVAQEVGSDREAMPTATGLLTITQSSASPDVVNAANGSDTSNTSLRRTRATLSPFDVSLEGYPLDRFVARSYRYFTDTANGDASGDAPVGRILIAYYRDAEAGGEAHKADETGSARKASRRDAARGTIALTLYDLRKRPAQVYRITDGVEPSDVLWERDAIILRAGGRWYKLTGAKLIRQTSWKFTFH